MDSRRQPWFGPKTYGFGLKPVTWQGWWATYAFVAIVAASVLLILFLVPDPTKIKLTMLPVVVAELAIFLAFAYAKSKP
jgi:hypothetical protein